MGPNQYRKGASDCLEGQDPSEDKQECRIITVAAYLAPQTAIIVAMSCSSKLPEAFVVVVISTQFPTRFDSGHLIFMICLVIKGRQGTH